MLDNLLGQSLQVARPNTVWVSDIACVRMGAAFIYRAIVLDVYDRKVVGWRSAAASTPRGRLRPQGRDYPPQAPSRPYRPRCIIHYTEILDVTSMLAEGVDGIVLSRKIHDIRPAKDFNNGILKERHSTRSSKGAYYEPYLLA